jgi:hypothetical protein
MKIYGASRRSIARDDVKPSRSRETRAAREEAEDQIENALHPAELALIACDAGQCPHGCHDRR